MPTFSLSDNFNGPVALPVKWTSVSALYKYLKSESLHLIVFPDFLQHKDQPVSGILPQPLLAHLKVGGKFQLGGIIPEIDVTPGSEIDVEMYSTSGANLFEDDPFPITATIPPDTAYVGVSIGGSLDLGVSGTSGDLTFGFDANSGAKFGYWKAFRASGPEQPTLGDALARCISEYTVPGDMTDLGQLQLDDICTASGTGSIKVSGGVQVSVTPNPLASVNLPLKTGTLTVQEGAMTGLSASFMLTGSYQVRARRLSAEIVELSLLKQKGTTLKVDLSASAGIAVKVGETDLIASLLKAIDPKTDNSQLLEGGLTADEAGILSAAIKDSIDHSLQASFDEVLSRITDEESAFQYLIDLEVALRDPVANDAVHRALEGDLSKLTALEKGTKPGSILAPGVTMISSAFSKSVEKIASLKINLLGLINVVSISDLIRASKIIKDPVTGDLTLTDSVTGQEIEASANPLVRGEQLRKAMFNSLLITAAYKASGAVETLKLTSQSFHFALNPKTNLGVVIDYLNWLKALDLITQAEKDRQLQQFHMQGPSTCLLRMSLTNDQCRSIFFDSENNLRSRPYYLDLGRRVLMELMNDKIEPYDVYRYRLLDQHWNEAFELGPTQELAALIGITSLTPDYTGILSQLIGDIYEIAWWASSMTNAGIALQSMNSFLAGRDPVLLRNDHEFAMRRDDLQKNMADIVKNSKARFSEPWGMVSLFRAAGSLGASARIVTQTLTFTKP